MQGRNEGTRGEQWHGRKVDKNHDFFKKSDFFKFELDFFLFKSDFFDFYDFFIYCAQVTTKQVVIFTINERVGFNIHFLCCVSSSTATVAMIDKTLIAFISLLS